MSDSDHHDHSELSDVELRVRTLESILTEKGYIDPAAVDALVPDSYETRVGPRNGAQVVAKACTDEGFAQWLREDATAAIASCGFGGLSGCHMVAVESTPTEHNVVMCTLCSRYPVAGARPAAGLVQIGTVPLAHGDGSFSESSAPRRTSAGLSSPNAHEDEMRSAPGFIHDT